MKKHFNGKKISFFTKTNRFLEEQIGNKKVCDIFVHAGMSGLSILFIATNPLPGWGFMVDLLSSLFWK